MKNLLFSLCAVFYCLSLHSQTCIIGTVNITSDSDVTSFSSLYHNCDTLIGAIHVKGQNITNLDSLYVIKNFEGNILIDSCQNLTSIFGLRNVENVKGSLTLKLCPLLNKLDGFQGLKKIITLDIRNNASLNNVMALNNLKAVMGYFFLNNLPKLNLLPPFDSLKRVGVLSIANCGITVVDGFNYLDTIIAGPNMLEYGILFNLTDLISFKGFNKVRKIGKANLYSGALIIQGSDNWVVLDAFHSLDTILGELSILYFIGIEINAFQNLKSVENEFFISNCDNLTNLSNFSNLSELRGILRLLKCKSLLSLDGIKNVKLANYKTTVKPAIWINSNENLSQCHIETICDHLANPTKLHSIDIENNKEDCNSAEEILALCSVGVDPDIDDVNIKLSPNPFSIAISIESQQKGVVIIYDVNGRKVLSHDVAQGLHSIDATTFSNGIFWVKFTDEEGKTVVKKMIKME